MQLAFNIKRSIVTKVEQRVFDAITKESIAPINSKAFNAIKLAFETPAIDAASIQHKAGIKKDQATIKDAVMYGVNSATKLARTNAERFPTVGSNSTVPQNSFQRATRPPFFGNRLEFLRATLPFGNQKREYSTKPTYIRRIAYYYQLENKNVDRLYIVQQKYYDRLYIPKGKVADLRAGGKLTFKKIEDRLSIDAKNLTQDGKVCIPVESLDDLQQIITDGNFQSCKTKSEKVKKIFQSEPIIGYLSIRDDGTFKSKSVLMNGELHTSPSVAGVTPDYLDNSLSTLNEPNPNSPIIIILNDNVKGDTTMTLGNSAHCKEHRKGPVPLTEPNINFFPLTQGLNPSKMQTIEDSPAKIETQIHDENLSLGDIAKVRFRKGSGVTEDSPQVKWFKDHNIPVEIEKSSNYEDDNGW